MDGVVEEEGVTVADGEVELTFEFGAEGSPVALNDGVDVPVVVPVGDDLLVDDAGERVDHVGWVAVRTLRGKDGLPDIPLLGGAAVGAEDVLEAVLGSGVGDDGAVGLAVGGDGDLTEGTLAIEGVGVVVEVDILVGVKVYGVGAGGVGAVVEVGVEDLSGDGLPSAGAAAVGGAGPALAYSAELLFNCGD